MEGVRINEEKEIYLLDSAVVLGLCGGLCREEVFMIYLKGILKLWEETSKNKDLSHVMLP